MRSLCALAAVFPTLLLATACTGSGDSGSGSVPAGGSPPATEVPSVPPTTPPALAGSGEARALSRLPDGPASGSAVIAYSGVGEIREPFKGTCSSDGETTRIDGAADTARIRLDVSPEGARLALDDLGLAATSDLATGRYDVSGDHLSLATRLVQDGHPVGSVELEIDCGR